MIKRLKRFHSEKRVLFLLCCALLLALLIAAAVSAVYVARVYHIKAIGVTLTPTGDHEIINVRYYLQNDPEWGGDKIGGSGSSIGGAGCLVTCVASAITDLGVPVTPKDVNARLTEVGGFDGGDLIWYKINEAFPEIDYRYSRTFSGATIERDLESGLLPIVNVRFGGHGMTHWLLIIGASDGEFLAFDPLNADKEPIKLSKHGKVHAYRVLTRGD